MKPPKIFKSLTPLVIAAILLSFVTPVADAQRRRTRTRAAHRARRTAPRTTPAQTQAAPRPSPVLTQPAPTDNAVAPRAADEAVADERRGPQDERAFEEMIGADTYGAYVELRRVGTLAQANELKTALAGLKLFGDAETKPVEDLVEFVAANYESLAEARFVMLFMAARPRVPVVVSALEFPSAQDAAAFEPKYRQFADEQLKSFRAKYEGPKPSPARRTSARERRRPETKPTPSPFDFAFRRVGRVLIASEKGLSLKRLRGEASAPSFADSARFQNARTRFSTDSLFVYVDTGVVMQGWMQATKEADAGFSADSAGRVAVGESRDTEGGIRGEPEIAVIAPTVVAPVEAATPEPDEDEEGEPTEAERKMVYANPVVTVVEEDKPSEEQRAVMGMGGLMRSLWGGLPRIPGAFALGVRLDNNAVVLRLAVENNSDGKVSIIPFLPNFIAGPPVTASAAEVAPADADIFFTTSLDWEQVYTSTLGSASLGSTFTPTAVILDDDGGKLEDAGSPASKPPTPGESVALAEKLFGFKFREDLIPALGNEIAFSMPFDSNDFFGGRSYRRVPKGEGEKEEESKAGPAVIVTLNDPEKIRKILPRVFVALGFVPFGGGVSQAERREGFEINSAGGFAYSIIDRFLVISEDVAAVRHVVDSYAARRTLAATDSYRDATSWQAPQKLVQAFVSEALMRATVEETKRRSGDSIDPLVRTLIAQLEAPSPESASFETTNEGDSVVHELRVPVSLIQTYALSIAVGVRDAPVISAESSATYALYELLDAEMTFMSDRKKERYGTLEELIAEKILDNGFAERSGYTIEVNASGDKFAATATPKDYGKSGRRSFFLDETGTMRAADHKGKPATASDPPVD